MHLRKRLAVFCVTLALLCFGGQSAQAAGNKLTVMTRNMYLGTDFDEIFAAQGPEQLLAEVAEAYAEVQASNPPARISAMADEIYATKPDLISIQEVALWQTGPFLNPAPATTTTYDFLQILLDELAERGLDYEAVAVLTNFEAEVPAFGPAGGPFDVRFTDRFVVLARVDPKNSPFEIVDVEAQHFATTLMIITPTLGPITIQRGWITVDAEQNGKTFRFVATHLESFSPLVRDAQALELLAGPLNTALPVVLAGDLNTDAESADPVENATYQLLLSAGFTDAWEATNPNKPGYTWPLFLENPFEYVAPTRRIDLVLTRGGIEARKTDVVGEKDVTRRGDPMPSDHAGVMALLRFVP